MTRHNPGQLNTAFIWAHTEATEKYGLDWFYCNREVVDKLRSFGIDPSDPLVKAVASLAVRVTLAQLNWVPTIKLEE